MLVLLFKNRVSYICVKHIMTNCIHISTRNIQLQYVDTDGIVISMNAKDIIKNLKKS